MMHKVYNYFKKEKKLSVVLLLLIGLSFILTFKTGYNCDEQFSIDWTALAWKDMWHNLVNDVHPPLYYLGLKIWRFLFGYAAFPARMYSLISFVGILSISYFIKSKFGCKSVIWYLTFICSTPFAFQKSTEVRMYGWTSFWAMANGIFFYMIIKKRENKYWGWFCFTGILTAYNHYYGLLLMITTFLGLGIWTIFQKSRPLFLHYIRICAICIICYLPWLFVAIRQVMQVNQEYWIEWPTSRLAAIRDLFYSIVPYSEKIYMSILVVIPVLAFLFFIISIRCSHEKAGIMLWCMTLVLGLWFVWLISSVYTYISGRPIMVSRYLIPGVYMFILGSSLLAQKMPRWLLITFCIPFTCMACISYYDRIIDLITLG